MEKINLVAVNGDKVYIKIMWDMEAIVTGITIRGVVNQYVEYEVSYNTGSDLKRVKVLEDEIQPEKPKKKAIGFTTTQ